MSKRSPDFGTSLKAAKTHLERLQRARDHIDVEIGKMEQVVAALRAVAQPDDTGTALTSLADAIRTTLKASFMPLSAPAIGTTS